VGVREGFPGTLLGELLDVETVGAAAEDDALPAAGDFDNEVPDSASGTSRDSLGHNFDQQHRNGTHQSLRFCHRCPRAEHL
jgi:hypothetical protein